MFTLQFGSKLTPSLELLLISAKTTVKEEKIYEHSPATFVKQSVGWSIALGVLMILTGLLAIASPLAAGIEVNVLVAWLLVFSGCAHLAFAWSRRSAGGFLWELLLGLVYAFTGGYLLVHPAVGLASLTIALGTIFSWKPYWNLFWDSRCGRLQDPVGFSWMGL